MAGQNRRPSTPAQRAQAAEAREAKLAELHQSLTEQVAALANGPQWRGWLDVAAKFHSYSFNNTLAILAQRPDATRVAGYSLWQQLGRQVNKGEKGLVILAPVTRSIDPADGADERPMLGSPSQDTPSTRRLVGFRPAYVWDICQTSGDPLPLPPAPTLLSGKAPPGLWDALAAQCAIAGFTVDRRPIAGDDGPNGYTAFGPREVVVRSDVDDAQAVKTLAHELGHVLLHDAAGFDAGRTVGCRGTREVEAESLAYLVAAGHGLDTSEYTFAYVASWAAETGNIEEALRTTGARVLTAAHHVLDVNLAHMWPVAADDMDQAAAEATKLAGRVAVGADRAAAMRAEAAATPARPDAAAPRDPILAATVAAAQFFADGYEAPFALAAGQHRSAEQLATPTETNTSDRTQAKAEGILDESRPVTGQTAPVSSVRSPATADRWAAILEDKQPNVTTDPHWLTLAALLDRIDGAGGDVPALIDKVLRDRSLPANHPARSLEYRLSHAAPALARPNDCRAPHEPTAVPRPPHPAQPYEPRRGPTPPR